jgi:hypothetical protein
VAFGLGLPRGSVFLHLAFAVPSGNPRFPPAILSVVPRTHGKSRGPLGKPGAIRLRCDPVSLCGRHLSVVVVEAVDYLSRFSIFSIRSSSLESLRDTSSDDGMAK